MRPAPPRFGWRLARWSYVVALAFGWPRPGDAQQLVLHPPSIPENAAAVRVEIRRADSRPFCREGEGPTWVGVSFGTMQRPPQRTRPAAAPVVVEIAISAPDELWQPAPRAGDHLMVTVYLGSRPVSAPARLEIGPPASHDGNAGLRPRERLAAGSKTARHRRKP